ncbi:MAG: hypothetical protein BHW64_04350 [Candidatus Melainabacteria bacterium LEY3_CP_29_8]|nr:MAG: hypothetical protein BHW64_04350 [Candidatus Melainabacteria bacterium LEY3_CP_29_8]
MTNKKPNYIIKFDGEKYSKEEQAFLIYRFCMCLSKLSAKQNSKKLKTKQEQQEYEEKFTNFASKAFRNIME